MNTTTLPTPAGPFTIVASDEGAVRASGFTTDVGALLALVTRRRGRTATTP